MSEADPDVVTRGRDEQLAALADDFLRRHRAGERPTVAEYAANHPELSDRIRDLFPAMMTMEQIGVGPTVLGRATPAERVGAIVGRYKLLGRIGEGGFGVVFIAEQQHPVRREVALKVIKPGFDTGQVIARFEAERQALALMDHENIAKVFDAGATDSGRPYFVMELVRGVPITEYCDKNQLPPRQRLELFVQVCRAVQHAHTKGIIHRDIKPTNVLVTLHEGVAVPKVIDFGVAKATGQQLTDKTLFTNFAQMVGTPLYMSPEQAEMTSVDVDTRSDVYSLGVLLYEMLTGTTPLDKDRLKKAAFDEVRRIIREEEPPRPSTRLSTSAALASISAQRHTDPGKLTKLVRGELDWIVMKALEKDRSRRYETANGFASDVQRYLADEPVLAGPPTVRYRFRKFARRHWRALTVAVAFVVLLASAVVTLSVALVAVNRERHEKEVALEAEGKRRKQAREALDAMSSRVIEYWLAKQTELLPEHRQFLQQALTYYEEFATDTGQGEEARAGVAHAYGRVGIIRNGLGHYQDAEAAWRRSGELYAGLAADFPTHRGYQGDLAQTQYQLGRLLYTTGRPREAEAAYTQALTIQQQLVRDVPTRAEFRLELAKSYYLLGVVLAETGRATESEAAQTHGRNILEQLTRDYPTRPEFRKELGACYIAFGVFLKNNGRHQESAEAVRQAVAIYEKLATDFPAVPLYRFWLVQAYISFGNLLEDISRSSQAQEAYGQAVTISRQLAADFPTVPDYRDALTRSLHGLGDVFRISNRFDEAEQAYREVLTIRKQLAADFPAVSSYRQTLAVTLNNLGILCKNTSRSAEAEDLYGQAIAVQKQLAADFPKVSDYHNEVAGGMVNLARMLLARKEFDGARRLLEEALPHHQAALKANPQRPDYRKFYRNNRWRLSETLLALKDHAAAAATAEQFLQAAVEPARDPYTAAGLLAGCVRVAAQDERLTDSKRQELTTTYGDRAMAALRQAFEKRANELARMKDDPNLEPLRHRQDFQELLRECAATTQP